MIRRLVVCLLLAVLLPTGSTKAQQPAKIPRIAFLSGGSSSSGRANIDAVRQGLSDLGYVEGKNIAIEYRFAEGKLERLTDLATELALLKVAVIVAGGTPAALAAQHATKTVPVVFAGVADPISVRLVANLGRPGGNITGTTTINSELTPKRLEVLKEVRATISRVAFVHNPADASNIVSLKELQYAAGAMGLTVRPAGVRDPGEFDQAFAGMIREGVDALMVSAGAFTSTHSKRIVDLAGKARLPAMYGESRFVEAGGLMSYAANFPQQYRRAATYVDKILKGANPADLPVEQPTKFELVINLKTAKQIGLTIPQSVLFRADRVIK